MSSVTQTGQHRPFKNLFEKSPDEQPARNGRPVRQPRRLWKWAGGATLLLVAAVWLTPVLIAHSPMMGWIVAGASSDLDGSVQVGSASLGWFSPVGLSKVEIRDSQGQTVMTIPQIDGDRALVSLAFNSSRLGKFRLEKPQLTVVLDDKGSNIQRLIAKYLEPKDDPSTTNVGVVIVDGTVAVEDRTAGKNAAGNKTTNAGKWRIEKLALDFDMPADGAMTLTASGNIPDGSQAGQSQAGQSQAGQSQAGQFNVELNMPGTSAEASAKAANTLAVKTGSLPLEKLAGLINAFAPNAGLSASELAGRLDSKIECRWPCGGSTEGTTVSVDTAVKNLRLADPRLGSDRVALDNLLAVCDLSWQGDGFALEKASLDCDLGRLALAGSLRMDPTDTAGANKKDSASIDSLGVLAPYARQTFKLQGNLDLAHLAAMLPETLHIHEQTRVTAGSLTVALSSSKGPDGMVWQGSIETSDLTAMRRGRELVWQQPIAVTLDAHESNVGPVIKELKCSSTFLNIKAVGWREDLEASLNFDLDRLAQRLDGFVDLKGAGMSGTGWVNLDWKRDKQNAFMLDADLQISRLVLSMGGLKPLTENSITTTVNATGRTDFHRVFALDTTEIEVRAGGEELRASLTAPVPQIDARTVWPLKIDAQGQLAGWVERAKSWVAVEDLNLAGAYRLHVQGSGSPDGVAVQTCELTVNNLNVVGHGLHVVEPQAKLAVSGQYDTAARRMLLKKIELENPTLYAAGQSLILGMPKDKPLEMAGDVSYRADLAGLQRWTADPAKPQAWRVAGRLSGKGRLKQVSDVTNGSLEATIENLTAVDAGGQSFTEPSLRLVAGGVYENSKRLLTLNQLSLASQAVSANLSGKINAADTSPNGRADARIDGRLNYNMEKLTALLRPYIGNGVYIAGNDSRPLAFAGPLNLEQCTAQAGLSWQQAYAYGFRVGPGEVKLALHGGTVQLAPTSLPVSQGRVNLAAGLKLSPAPMLLNVAPGPLVQQVQIDPDMCAYGLQYVAPVLAGATSAQGQFSIDIEECQIPLYDPAAGKLRGRFTVHSVEIGPGPLIRELTAVLLPGTAPAKLTRESVIAFQMAERRIYHQGLELEFPELTIRTQGSVGMDKSIDMVAEMPVPPAWLRGIRDARVLAATRGQKVVLPINGTLDRPQVDRRRLAEYTQQFARQATRNVIETEVGNQLNRLLGPRK